MNRRKFISAGGTVGLGAIVLWGAYQLDEGNIDLGGEEAAVSERVSRESESFSFEVTAGEEIFITVRDAEEDRGRRGGFALYDPDDNSVLGTSLDRGQTRETHTAEQDGTYRLNVTSNHERVHVSVSLGDSGL